MHTSTYACMSTHVHGRSITHARVCTYNVSTQVYLHTHTHTHTHTTHTHMYTHAEALLMDEEALLLQLVDAHKKQKGVVITEEHRMPVLRLRPCS